MLPELILNRQTHEGLLYQSQAFHLGPCEGKRPLSLYLPPDYFKQEAPSPLALFFDGQNLFEQPHHATWRLHHILQQRAQAGLPVPIVVGLHHGPDRDAELSPYDPYPGKRGLGKQLFQCLHEELWPRLQQKLNVDLRPENTLVAGSSLGGLMALYGVFHYPERYGKALVMSPALWPGRFEIIQALMQAEARQGAKIYLDHGQQEGQEPWGPLLYQQSELLADLLTVMGFGATQLKWISDPAGTHSESCWERRLPAALDFLYGETNATTRD